MTFYCVAFKFYACFACRRVDLAAVVLSFVRWTVLHLKLGVHRVALIVSYLLSFIVVIEFDTLSGAYLRNNNICILLRIACL